MGEHGVEVREKAVELIDSGYGKVALANALAISDSIAEHWIRSYKAVGKGVFLSMGSKRRTYDRETKLAAVLDFLEGGLTKQEAMAKHAIASLTDLYSFFGHGFRNFPHGCGYDIRYRGKDGKWQTATPTPTSTGGNAPSW